MKKKAKRSRSRLPSVPTGYELEDLMWAVMSTSAEEILEGLPKEDVNPSWAHVEGFARFATTWVTFLVAKGELDRTTTKSLHRLRTHQLSTLGRELTVRAKLMGAAIVQRARSKYPEARPAQIFLLVRDRFRVLSERFFSFEPPERPILLGTKDGFGEP